MLRTTSLDDRLSVMYIACALVGSGLVVSSLEVTLWLFSVLLLQ